MTDLSSIIVVPAVALAAPVLSAQLARVVKVPIVVFEIALGILVGPAALGLVQISEFLTQLSNYGLAMLFSGLADGAVPESTAASLIGAGMLSVLLYPLLGLAQRRRSATAPPPEVALEAAQEADETDVPDEA